MKNPMTTTVRLFGAAALAAAALYQAPASAAVINGDFSDATKFTTIAGSSTPLPLTGTGTLGTDFHATADAGWFAAVESSRKWEQTGGVATFDPVGKSDRGAAMYQVINDGKSTKGAQFFSFDIDLSGTVNRSDVLVYLVGWNTGQTVPTSRSNTQIGNSGNIDADLMILGDATPLITTTGVDSEGGFLAFRNGSAQNGQTQINSDGVPDPVSLTADFGAGYDFIGIVFQAGNGNLGNWELDNVAITPVPEPGSLALLGLGGLLIAGRRRRSS
ncbi:MAG: PEP-CTERM sorting domain-containing protein [Planctomycetota bacterium]